ncbi:hypothetical protein ACROAK_05070 [Shewanella oncorhynchi]|uniref:hypothetical protein n=1 Tax=Shewanella oncorhynchi TaxID=2726434 RepID=UPI003D7A1C24
MTTPSTSPQAEQQTQTHESETSFRWLIILLAIVAACLLTLYFMNFNGSWGNQGDFGAFGDFLGGVLNPILGFATVGLLIWSLKLQMNELALSRQELALTRQELAETKNETALSRRAMQDQVTHLQNEALLNEIMRLMVDLRAQYQSLIHIPLFITNDLYNILIRIAPSGFKKGDSIRQVSVYNIIYESSAWNAQRSEDLKIFLKNNYDDSTDISAAAQWQELENILKQFSNIVIKYHKLSNSPDLAPIYLDEARKMLKPFQDIFWTEAIANELGKINTLVVNLRSQN